jgi:hypothetical protein
MPLRATSDTGDLQAFELDSAQWSELKGNYKALNLRMPCCQVPAVPKTSTLGNFFFAHARRGECTTAPESAEHIFCKSLIAKSAAAAGWAVTTERAGVSLDGEEWVADVFCVKGSTQIALEVQMSPQSRDEALQRQSRYKASGVRAAWFYGEKLHKDLKAATRDMPLFGLSAVKVGHEPNIGLTETCLTDFVTALLGKRVSWTRHQATESFYLAVLRRNCPRCERAAGLVYGYSRTQVGLPSAPLAPVDVDAALQRLFTAMTSIELESVGLCHLLQVPQPRWHTDAYWSLCPRCRSSVTSAKLCELLDAADIGPSHLSGFETLYFDRAARDAGTWVLISENGEYQAIA